MKSLYEIYEDISIGLRSFASRVIKDGVGKFSGETYETSLKKMKDDRTFPKHTPEWVIKNKHNIEPLNENFKIAVADFGLMSPAYKGQFGLRITAAIWKDGTWCPYYDKHLPQFANGRWLNGIWKNGEWTDSIWENGTWEDGMWFSGTWNDGTWLNGEWERGNWHNGIWNGGKWNYGTWYNGTWEKGIWKNGIWNAGEWKSGEWVSGWIYDPNKKGKAFDENGKIKEGWELYKPDNRYVKSPMMISPKQYFEGVIK